MFATFRLLLFGCFLHSLTAQTFRGIALEDHSGTVLPSVDVRIAQVGQRTLAAELETDREGRFEVSGLAAGDYQLELIRAGYAATKLSAKLGGGVTEVTARLIKRGVISGQVHDGANRPIPGATVFALPKPPGREAPRPPKQSTPSVTADAQGNYRIHNLAPGEYVVAATFGASTRAMGSTGVPGATGGVGSGYAFFPNNARPAALAINGGEEHRNIDVTVNSSALFTVSGKVEPKPAASYFIVALLDAAQPSFAVAVNATPEDGSFKFTGIPAGTYRVVAATTGRARNGLGFLLATEPVFGTTRVAVSGQDVTGVVLSPDATRTVTFGMRTSGPCPAAAQLELSPLEEWGTLLAKTVALKAGEPTTVRGLAPARYAISSPTAPAQCYIESESLLDLTDSAPSEPVQVSLAPAGGLRGKLNLDGKNASGFVIALAAAEDATAVEIASPDNEGRFAFSSLRPGRYKLGAYVAGQRAPDMAKLFEFEVRGGSNAEVEIPLPEEVRR